MGQTLCRNPKFKTNFGPYDSSEEEADEPHVQAPVEEHEVAKARSSEPASAPDPEAKIHTSVPMKTRKPRQNMLFLSEVCLNRRVALRQRATWNGVP